MEVLQNKEVLIDNLDITASITRPSDSNLKNIHKKNLTILIELRYPQGSSKEIYIQITEEADPLVLLTAVVTESDYQALYSSQGLLIDFSSFPHHLQSHIKQCASEIPKEDPKEVLVLRVNSITSPPALSKLDCRENASLEVVQVGIVRHFSLFSLAIAPASDETKLQHISSSIKLIKNLLTIEKNETRDKENNLSSEINRLRINFAKKENEYDNLQKELECLKSLLSEQEEKFRQKKVQIKDKNISDLDRKLANQKRELEAKIKKIQFENSKMAKERKDILEEKDSLRRKLRDSEINTRKLVGDLRHKTDQLAHYKSSNKILEKEVSEKDELIKRIVSDKETLFFHNESLSKELSKLNDQICTLNGNNVKLKNDLEEVYHKLEEEKQKYGKLNSELLKSIDVLSKFKKEKEVLKSEIKRKDSTLEEVKRTLSEKDSLISNLTTSLQELVTKLDAEKKISENYKEQVEDARHHATEQEKVLQNNKNTIAFLNKRLEELEMTEARVRKAPLSEGYIVPSSRNVHYLSGNPSGLTTSTPLSGAAAPHSNLSSIKAPPHVAEEARMLNNVLRIEEDFYAQGAHLEEQENKPQELHQKYSDPKRKALPKRGLLRVSDPPLPTTAGFSKAPHARGIALPKKVIKNKAPQGIFIAKKGS